MQLQLLRQKWRTYGQYGHEFISMEITETSRVRKTKPLALQMKFQAHVYILFVFIWQLTWTLEIFAAYEIPQWVVYHFQYDVIKAPQAP